MEPSTFKRSAVGALRQTARSIATHLPRWWWIAAVALLLVAVEEVHSIGIWPR